MFYRAAAPVPGPPYFLVDPLKISKLLFYLLPHEKIMSIPYSDNYCIYTTGS